MSTSTISDACQNPNSTKEFSLSFRSHGSGSQSESGISQRLEGTQNFTTPSLLSFEAAPTTGTMTDQKPLPSDALLASGAPTKAAPPTTSKKTGKSASRAATSTTSGSPSTAGDATPLAEPAKVKNQNVRRNVYISGVPPTYRSEEFRQLCQQFGRVEAAKLCVDNRNAPTKAYGFALYYSEESAASCIRGLNGSFLQGRCVQARLADSHATPQPLGDAGAAINTTLPLPNAQRDRRDNSNRTRRTDESRRGSQGRRSLTNSAIPGPALVGSAMPIQVPFSPMAMAATARHSSAMPMPITQCFPLMTAAGGVVPPPTATSSTSPLDAQMTVNASPSTAFFTVTPASCSPRTDCGFGATGTPMVTPLSPDGSATNVAQHGGLPAAGSTLSPASMALTPPLISSQSSDACSSLPSPGANTVENTNGGAPDALSNNKPDATVPPFPLPFPFPNMTSMMPAGSPQMMVTAAAMNNSSGATSTEWGAPPPPPATSTPAFVYYSLPTGGYGAFAPTAASANGVNAYPGSSPQSGMSSMTASANPMPGGAVPFTCFPMGALPVGGSSAGMPALPPYLPPPPMNASNSGTEGFSSVPPNVVMMDNGMGLQLQMLR
ncbi:hypothetical protein JKF63_04847 [Porcisia hertigi]|uniref:RRM domain-containing protein n=1 Tax=Porcisia hertigi TaxID=2761500 RepID=A0A836L9U9_9TRYP|nr:hypothetical protein JKF63_04847 [Porcisia hertigi]